jgi:hypothetical protein
MKKTTRHKSTFNTQIVQEIVNVENARSLLSDDSPFNIGESDNNQFNEDMQELLEPIIGPPVNKRKVRNAGNVDYRVIMQPSVQVI